MKHYDLVVVGLGIMGAATAWRASRTGADVLALDAHGPSHRGGSSHGATRIYRQAYWEGDSYLEWLWLADRGWKELEACSETRLLVPTGGIFIGPQSTGVVAGSLATSRKGAIPHEHLGSDEIRHRFPQFRVSPRVEAVFEPGAYAILAEESRLQMLNEAVRDGARLSYGTRVVELGSAGTYPTIRTSSGEAISAGAVVVCAGAWAAELVPELAHSTTPYRVPIYWFKSRAGSDSSFGERSFPVFLYEEEQGSLLYGIPSGISSEIGVKIGFHNRQLTPSDPTLPAPNIKLFEPEITSAVERILPGLDPTPLNSKWCFYTMSLDESFVIDRSRLHSRIFFVSACSGHGFKFSPAIGQVLTELALGRSLSADASRFAISRFDIC